MKIHRGSNAAGRRKYHRHMERAMGILVTTLGVEKNFTGLSIPVREVSTIVSTVVSATLRELISVLFPGCDIEEGNPIDFAGGCDCGGAQIQGFFCHESGCEEENDVHPQ